METDSEIIQMIKLIDKDIKVITTISMHSKKVEASMHTSEETWKVYKKRTSRDEKHSV